MNLQLQRLLGQQSTAEFAGLHIDPKVIGEQNSRIQGPEIRRKNNTIVNTGDKLSREELRERIAKNKEMYELPEAVWQAIELDYMTDEDALLEEKKKTLREMKAQLKVVQRQIKNLEFMHPLHAAKLKFELEQVTPSSLSQSSSPSSSSKSPSSSKSSISETEEEMQETNDEEMESDNEIDELVEETDEEETSATEESMVSPKEETRTKKVRKN
ncbi:unnamed protein product [Absidia cylindrospora]